MGRRNRSTMKLTSAEYKADCLSDRFGDVLQFSAQPSDKPNVLLIYTDDHRYSGVHALGGQPVRTPHLDELANSGMAFTRSYLMGSFLGATCVPSRQCCIPEAICFSLNVPAEQSRPIIAGTRSC